MEARLVIVASDRDRYRDSEYTQGFQDKVAAVVRSHSDEFDGPPPPGSALRRRPSDAKPLPSPQAPNLGRRRISALRRVGGRVQIFNCHFDFDKVLAHPSRAIVWCPPRAIVCEPRSESVFKLISRDKMEGPDRAPTFVDSALSKLLWAGTGQGS